MRYAIMDEAKKAMAAKRGDTLASVELGQVDIEDGSMAPEDLLQLEQSLARLATVDRRLASIVELRYFAGLTHGEIGELLGLSERSVRRDWECARSYLVSQFR